MWSEIMSGRRHMSHEHLHQSVHNRMDIDLYKRWKESLQERGELSEKPLHTAGMHNEVLLSVARVAQHTVERRVIALYDKDSLFHMYAFECIQTYRGDTLKHPPQKRMRLGRESVFFGMIPEDGVFEMSAAAEWMVVFMVVLVGVAIDMLRTTDTHHERLENPLHISLRYRSIEERKSRGSCVVFEVGHHHGYDTKCASRTLYETSPHSTFLLSNTFAAAPIDARHHLRKTISILERIHAMIHTKAPLDERNDSSIHKPSARTDRKRRIRSLRRDRKRYRCHGRYKSHDFRERGAIKYMID